MIGPEGSVSLSFRCCHVSFEVCPSSSNTIKSHLERRLAETVVSFNEPLPVVTFVEIGIADRFNRVDDIRA